ncbi:MAG: hypothetical protein AB7P01_15720 [Bacteroidia bacterium]
MKTKLLSLAGALLTFTAYAQFDPEKYFTDSVSFVYKVCYATYCMDNKYRVIVSNTELAVFVDSYQSETGKDTVHRTGFTRGMLSSINFYKCEIKKHNEYSNKTTPEEVYELVLNCDYNKPWFAHKSTFFKEEPQAYATLYFASSADAYTAKMYLQKMAQAAGY